MRLSQLVDCGQSAFGMRNADMYTVRIDVLTAVRAGSDGRALVQTQLRGTARGEGTDEAPCSARRRVS